MPYAESPHINELLSAAQKILIIQADNPDADSLGSALALEAIFADMDKATFLYCAVDIPSYLHYLVGWSRVSHDIPSDFDISIIVDASTESLLDVLKDSQLKAVLSRRPCVVIDHHAVVQNPITFATIELVDDTVSSTGELLYALARDLNWPVNTTAAESMLTAILGDTQGLSNDLTQVSTYRTVADIVEMGVDRQKLEESRRLQSKMPQIILKYKAELIQRTQFFNENTIALVSIPQEELNQYSALYNPGPLIQSDHLQTEFVQLSIVMKYYTSGRVTAAIRSTYAAPIANILAQKMGGGGHPYAAGFKVEDGRSFDEIKQECLSVASDLINNIEKQESYAAI